VSRPAPRGYFRVGSTRRRCRAVYLLSGLLGAGMIHPCAVLAAGPGGDSAGPPAQITTQRASITVEWRGPAADVGEAGLLEWIERSAAIVGGYYGQFPVRAVTIQVSLVEGERMGGGRTFGIPQPNIEVTVGRHVTAEALKDDWVLVHEMIHLALPAVAEEQNWLAEGIATYVEGIARTQAGNMLETDLWKEYVDSMPRGLPQANDRGLDRTHTHARTYWGGAVFCLIADVRIREQTNSRYGLQDALRAIRRVGAGMSAQWPIERILTTGDAATGKRVLQDLYMSMKDQPVAPDLNLLWTELGIRTRDGTVYFNDSARLAAARRAITRSTSPNPLQQPIQ
jgi:hypothetical protein